MKPHHNLFHFSFNWQLEFDPTAVVMRCKQWTKRLPYTALILTFASSLMLMVYMHSSTRVRLFPSRVNEGTIHDDSIPLVDFEDLGNRKPRVLLLVTAGSAPQRYDRRQTIRATWWKHCRYSQVRTEYEHKFVGYCDAGYK